MFAEALDQLLQETGGDLAIFCDYEGEAIGHASRGLDDYDVRLAGAQLGAVTTDLQQLAEVNGQPQRLSYGLVTDLATLLVEALPGHYYLLLRVPELARVPFARHRLTQLAERFLEEL